MRTDATYYRGKARETRALLQQVKDAERRRYLLAVAAQYEKLADDAEAT